MIGVAMIFLWLRAARQDQPASDAPGLCGPHRPGAGQLGHPALAGTRRRAPDLHYCTGQGGTGILRGSAMPRIMAQDPISAASTQPMNAPSRDAKQIAWGDVGARQEADLAELADWVEGLRAAAHTARAQGNITLAEALDVTRFEVYEGYLDEELDHKQSQAAARRSR